jgi:hypothetical protein
MNHRSTHATALHLNKDASFPNGSLTTASTILSACSHDERAANTYIVIDSSKE